MSLYRKYRSQKFKDIIGQEHVVQTLKGALSSGQIGHAYIFSGMRGTGKTSIARIFAKAVNCLDLKEGEPCGECGVCKETVIGNFLDLIEIDAASNRGIDDIRDLREKIKFAPSIGKYKIYIIDEVHMLTTDAFNALLKTLEEPPAHAIFILATTEIHKVPSTILSRCQRFDFHKIGASKMFAGVKEIAEKENIKIDDKGIQKIVSLSEGSLRDALSHLDQVSAFAKGGEISSVLLEDILGVANEDRIFDFFEIVSKKDIQGIMVFINEIVDQGKDLENFIREIIRFARKILMLKLGSNDLPDIIDLQRAIKIKENFILEDLVGLIEALNSVLKNTRFSFIPQLSFELEMVKLLSQKGSEEKTSNDLGGTVIKEPVAGSSAPKVGVTPAETLNIKDGSNEEESGGVQGGQEVERKEEERGSVSDLTKDFLSKLKEEKVMLHTFVKECEIIKDQGKLEICANSSFCFNSLSEKNNKMILDNIAKNVFGEEEKVCIVMNQNKGNVLRRDLIKDALSVFGGELIE